MTVIHTLAITIHNGIPVEWQPDEGTQELLCSLITVPLGHWQPLVIQTAGQADITFMLAHVMLHGEAHSIRI